jgi:polysaccharide export outer membrane protein
LEKQGCPNGIQLIDLANTVLTVLRAALTCPNSFAAAKLGELAVRVLLAIVALCVFLTGAKAQPLQPGDTISISVFQDPKLDRQMVISPTGMISFPLAGQIRASGLTPEALENTLKSRLKDKYATELDINVTLVATARAAERERLEDDLKPRVFITGEVNRPGPYVMRVKTNVMQAIAMAGGFGPFAAKTRIQIRRKIRGHEAIYFFDYRSFYQGADLDNNLVLKPGDVVIVPERGLFDVIELFDSVVR